MSLKRHAAGFVRETRAAALVEFTLVFPLLLVFLAGLSELGFAMHQQHIVQKAVRDAARYAARTSFAFKTCPLNAQTEWAALVTDTTNIALRGSVDPAAPLLISTYNNASMVTIADSCAPAGTFAPLPSASSSANFRIQLPVTLVRLGMFTDTVYTRRCRNTTSSGGAGL